MAAKPSIGIVGKGNVGTALQKGLARAGYPVQAVGKDPAKVKEVAQKADVVILAVPYGERANAVKEMGEALTGKTLVDVTNAVTPTHEFAGDVRRSGAEELQDLARAAKVVKAFNSVFADVMATGKARGQPVTLFVAADDADAKRRVLEVGAAIGFEAVDAGPLKNARWLEPLGYFNIQLGFALKFGTDMGFRLVGAPTTRAPEVAAATGR